jgi:hypothetical protein
MSFLFFLLVQGWVDGHATGAGGLLPNRVEESEASWDDFFFFYLLYDELSRA